MKRTEYFADKRVRIVQDDKHPYVRLQTLRLNGKYETRDSFNTWELARGAAKVVEAYQAKTGA